MRWLQRSLVGLMALLRLPIRLTCDRRVLSMFRSREKVVCWSSKRYDHILLSLIIEMCCEELWLRYYLYGDCRLFPEKCNVEILYLLLLILNILLRFSTFWTGTSWVPWSRWHCKIPQSFLQLLPVSTDCSWELLQRLFCITPTPSVTFADYGDQYSIQPPV